MEAPLIQRNRFLRLLAPTLLLSGCGGGSSDVPTVDPAPSMTARVPADYSNIAAAIASAKSGYTILLADGIYTGSTNTNLNFGGKDLKLRSANGSASVVVDCQGESRFITFDSSEYSNSSISGITVRNCGIDFFGAIYVRNASPSITDSIFENTVTSTPISGAAVFGAGGSPNIEKNLFRNTECDDLYLSGVLAFANSASPRVANNIFLGNRCRSINMSVPEGSAPIVVNNTMVGNRAGIYIDRRVSTATHWYSNNLIAGNERTMEVAFEFLPRTDDLASIWRNNLLFGNATDYLGTTDLTGAGGNLLADPRFVSYPADLRLMPASPAKDAGNPLHAPSGDYSGALRVGLPDIGAYEFR